MSDKPREVTLSRKQVRAFKLKGGQPEPFPILPEMRHPEAHYALDMRRETLKVR